MAKKSKLHFCDLIQLSRKHHGYTHHKTAQMLGLSSGQIISKWERGEARAQPHHLRKVAKLFKIKEHHVIDAFLHEERARLLRDLKKLRKK